MRQIANVAPFVIGKAPQQGNGFGFSPAPQSSLSADERSQGSPSSPSTGADVLQLPKTNFPSGTDGVIFFFKKSDRYEQTGYSGKYNVSFILKFVENS